MIRNAKQEDATAVVPLIIQAMGELANKFSNTKDIAKTTALFEYFFKQPDNQYSYQNTLVYEEDGLILGSLNAYDGGKLLELRKNFLDYLKAHNQLTKFNPEPETEAGEFYLDTISVNPEAQGKGIGKKLINAFCKLSTSKQFNRVGLIVDHVNPDARKVYEKVGFQVVGQRDFLGHTYDHMVWEE